LSEINGFLLVNKPLNFTSFDVIAKVRKAFNIKKVGHTGTLDPLATGLMVIGIGRATRFLEFHTGHTKEYEAEITFGSTSETYDNEGPLTQLKITNYELRIEDIKSCIVKNFLGEIEQIPPKYSALKINGEKYCNLTRRGIEVDIEAKKRKITIYENDIIDFSWPKLKLRIKCSSGTYIRSIAHDLGKTLKCGGYLSGLNRTMVENFKLEDAKKIEDISKNNLLPFDVGLDFKRVNLNKKSVQKLQYGQKLNLKTLLSESDYNSNLSKIKNDKFVQIYLDNEFQGIAEISGDILKAKKMIV